MRKPGETGGEFMRRLREEYAYHSKRVQTGIAMLMGIGRFGPAEPKHLRVGIDTSKADIGALAALLVKKGVCTEEELFSALNDGMKMEADRYEREVSDTVGQPVTLSGL